MNTTEREQIWESLQEPVFRKQFIDEHIDVGVAFQIHGLRERQGLKQRQLAERLGDERKQPLVSAWENPSYGKYTLGTLKDLAKAFDVGLLVRFVPFSTMVEWTINLTHDVIAPPSFSEEQILFHTAVSTALPHEIISTDAAFYSPARDTPHVNVPTTTGTASEKELVHA